MQPFLALITPVSSGGEPTHPIVPGGPPVGVWPPPGYPTHPIAPGGSPGSPTHPIYNPAYPDQGLPGIPPGIWGGAPVYPDQGLPGSQPIPSHPIVIPPDGLAPGIPSHPIYWPPYPSQGPGFPTHPIAPGGPPPGTPTHPIVIPGDDEAKKKFEVKTGWSPQTGWVTVIIPTGEMPTPSGGAGILRK